MQARQVPPVGHEAETGGKLKRLSVQWESVHLEHKATSNIAVKTSKPQET